MHDGLRLSTESARPCCRGNGRVGIQLLALGHATGVNGDVLNSNITIKLAGL